MPLVKRSPEKWEQLVAEVKARSAKRKARKKAALAKQKDKLNRESHKEQRRILARKLSWLNKAVRTGRYTTTEEVSALKENHAR